MLRSLTIAGSAVSLLFAGGIGGCYEDIEGAPPPARAQGESEPAVEPAPATARRSSDMPRSSGSTLGRAKDSAKRTVAKSDEHQRELEKQMEDQ